MVRFWASGREKLELDMRYDREAGDYVLTLYWSDRREEIERFTNLAAFRTRRVAVLSHCWIDGLPDTSSPSVL
jgi:hypothetical protein